MTALGVRREALGSEDCGFLGKPLLNSAEMRITGIVPLQRAWNPQHPVNAFRPLVRFFGIAPALLIFGLANDFRSLAPALCAGLAATVLIFMVGTFLSQALWRSR